MSLQTCEICNKNKTALTCDSCGDVSCKKCVQFIDEDFSEHIIYYPEDHKNKTYCLNCFNQGIDQELYSLNEIAEKAKNVDVFTKAQSKESQRYKRKEETLKVTDCDDKNEALMKLAFMAAHKGFDLIVDVQLNSKKIGSGKSHKKIIWMGSAIPIAR